MQVPTYTIADITTADPLGTKSGTATAGSNFTVTVGNTVLTVAVSGPGSVDVYQSTPSATSIDSLVLNGTTSATKLTVSAPVTVTVTTPARPRGKPITTVTPANVTVGRIIGGPGAGLNSLALGGDIVGDGTTDPDVWIDGGLITSFTFGNLGNNATGQMRPSGRRHR